MDLLVFTPRAFFWLMALWEIWKCSSEGVVEGKAVNASQAFNYCKLLFIIYKEAMAGNNYLRSCTYQKKKKKEVVNLQFAIGHNLLIAENGKC